MKKLVVAALVALFASQPAAATATLGDFDIYATNNAYISGPGGYGDIGAGSFTNANGKTATNFTSVQAATSALTAQAAALSDSYLAMAATGAFSSLNGAGTLTGTQAGMNVFNVSTSQLTGLWKLSLAGPGTGAIINVTGTGSFSTSLRFDLGGIGDSSQVLLNLADLTSAQFNGLNFNGSILAPDASVTMYGNSLGGSVVANSVHAQGVVIGGNGFSGFSPAAAAPAVPEPATWAMMIIGFAFVGLAMRRRRAEGARLKLA